MKSFKTLFIPFLILVGSFAVVAAEEEDSGLGEIIGDIIVFIIGQMVGACLVDTECSAVFVPMILFFLLGVLIITVILSCCFGYDPNDISDDLPSARRTTIFAAGVGFGALS